MKISYKVTSHYCFKRPSNQSYFDEFAFHISTGFRTAYCLRVSPSSWGIWLHRRQVNTKGIPILKATGDTSSGSGDPQLLLWMSKRAQDVGNKSSAFVKKIAESRDVRSSDVDYSETHPQRNACIVATLFTRMSSLHHNVYLYYSITKNHTHYWSKKKKYMYKKCHDRLSRCG